RPQLTAMDPTPTTDRTTPGATTRIGSTASRRGKRTGQTPQSTWAPRAAKTALRLRCGAGWVTIEPAGEIVVTGQVRPQQGGRRCVLAASPDADQSQIVMLFPGVANEAPTFRALGRSAGRLGNRGTRHAKQDDMASRGRWLYRNGLRIWRRRNRWA